MGQCHSKETKRPARALSPVRGVNRKGVDHPIKSANLDAKKATAVHVPIVEFENAVNEPVHKDLPVSVTQRTSIQAKPTEEMAKAVEDTVDEPAKKESSPRIKFEFTVGTLGTEIQSQPLENLAKAFEAMIQKMAKASPSSVNIDHFIDQINGVTEKVSEFSAKAEAFLDAIPNVSGKVGEAKGQVMAIIDSIASAHPILKISWFIVSAGYKMISDASKVNQEYLELPGQFQAILKDVSCFLDCPIKGITDNVTRKNLVKASERIILCLTDAAILFTKYMDTSGTTLSNINGSNKNKLDEMKARLADVQEAHQSAKDKGLFLIMATVARDVVDTKEAVYEVARRVENIDATLQAQAKESELAKLHQLCQKRDPHRTEFKALVARCAEGTRKWIVDEALESIENGAEKITWLRCEAGTGKSVIAGRVAKELEQKRFLFATFFCKFNNTKRNNIVGLIQTIAFELADINDQFRTALIKSLEGGRFQEVNKNKDPMPNTEDLLRLFLVEPMQAWPKNTSVVVVIDAIDEIKNISEDIHQLLGTFLRLEPVKFFITSRPEIKAKSMEIKKSSVAFLAFHQDDGRNLEDIRLFVAIQVDALFAEFPDFGLDDKKALEDMLVKKSLGLFIWITLVLGTSDGDDEQRDKVADFVEENETHLPKASNQQKMKEEKKEHLIKRLEESASMGLQDLYCRAFSEAFEQTGKKPQLNLFSRSVGTLLVVKVPMSKKGLSSLVQGDNIKSREILASLDNISALLRVDDQGKLSFIHKTVQDYLIGVSLLQDKSLCNNVNSISALLSLDDEGKLASIDKTVSDYHEGINSWKLNKHECVKDISFKLDFVKISFNVALSCLKLLNSALHKNMANPKLGGLLNYSDGHNNEWTIDQKCLTESVQYAVLYWSDHFVDAVKMVDGQQQLLVELKCFCKTQLLYYLEAILLLKKLDLVARVVDSVLSCLGDIHCAGTPSAQLPSSDLPSTDIPFTGIPASNNHSAADVHFISSILRDLKLVSINFRPQLMVSPLQVYNHALISVPQQTEYYITYHQMASARITMGAEQNWGPMTLFGHSKGVFSVAISPDNRTIVSGSHDKTVKVWDVQKGTCRQTLKGHSHEVTAVAIGPDSRTIVSGSHDKTVKVWDMQKGTCMQTLKGLDGHSDKVTAVAISPDGRYIVSGSHDKTVKVWDMQKGTYMRTLNGHKWGVTSVAISPDSRTIISGSWDKTVQVWHMQTGYCLEILKDDPSGVKSVAISPDGRTIVSGSWDKTVQVWDMQQRKCMQTLEGPKFHISSVNSVSISPDGMTIVSGISDTTVKVWDMQKGTCIQTLEGHTGGVNSVVISPDSRTIVSGSWDMTVKVWDMQKETCMQTLEGLKAHSEIVLSVAISPDSRTIVSGSWDQTVKVWDVQKGTCMRTLKGHSGGVYSVAIGPDGRTIVSGSHDKTVKVWDMQKETCMQTLKGHSHEVSAVAIGPDGRTIVSGSHDETVKVWDMQKETCMQTLKGLEGHSDKVTAVAISPDGRCIVSGSSDLTVKVWDMQRGICMQTLVGYSREVKSVAISPDGRTIISGSWDNTVKAWDMRSDSVTLDSGSKFAGSIAVSSERITLNKERDWLVSGEELLLSRHFHFQNVAGKVAVFADGKKIIAVVMKE
ncbi:hypothetical protein HDU80_000156 [Chytriomyces hyalinus]|nr:hypothetical protein HDU80_000156 [Chytriomyces hyalinus]